MVKWLVYVWTTRYANETEGPVYFSFLFLLFYFNQRSIPLCLLLLAGHYDALKQFACVHT